jgi:hypothetical protein
MTEKPGSWKVVYVAVTIVILLMSVPPVRAQDYQALLDAMGRLEGKLKEQIETESGLQQQQIKAVQQELDDLRSGSGTAADHSALAALRRELAQLKLEMEDLSQNSPGETDSDENQELLLQVMKDIDQLKAENVSLRSMIQGSQSPMIAGEEAVSRPDLHPVCLPAEAATAPQGIMGDVESFDACVEIDYFSSYVWRGLLLTDGPVFQPSVTADYAGFSFNGWASMDLVDVNDNQGRINELDFTAEYGWGVGRFGFAAGLVHYTFPHTDYAVTTELYGSVELDAPLGPSVKLNWDVDQANGFYATFNLSHDVNIPITLDNVSMSVGLAAGVAVGSSNYNRCYYGVADTRMTDFHAGITAPITLHDNWSFAATAGYSAIVNNEIKERLEDNNKITFGILVSAGL